MLSLTFLIGQVYWQQFLTAFVGLNSLFFFCLFFKKLFLLGTEFEMHRFFC